ncbi:MAG: anti-sigma factor [Burkholderiales bacterium]
MSSELPITEADLQAYIDGRLAQGRHAEIEAWLATRPDEAERIAQVRSQRDNLRAIYDPVLGEPVPERLARVAQRGPRPRVIALAAGWVALGAVAGVLAGWQLHGLQDSRMPSISEGASIARSAAVAHATYSPEVRHPVEVAADQQAHLVAWLSKRLGATVRAPVLDAAGLSLVGGRLLPGEGDPATGPQPAPVAQFMYQGSKGQRVTLYVRTETRDHGETAFRFAREGSVSVFYWIDRKFGYALSSSDLDRAELLRLANLVYRQLNP